MYVATTFVHIVRSGIVRRKIYIGRSKKNMEW